MLCVVWSLVGCDVCVISQGFLGFFFIRLVGDFGGFLSCSCLSFFKKSFEISHMSLGSSQQILTPKIFSILDSVKFLDKMSQYHQ